MTSWWARWRLKSPASRLFTQPFVQAQVKENIKAPRHRPLWGNSPVTGEFPAQRASNAEKASFDDVIMNAIVCPSVSTRSHPLRMFHIHFQQNSRKVSGTKSPRLLKIWQAHLVNSLWWPSYWSDQNTLPMSQSTLWINYIFNNTYERKQNSLSLTRKQQSMLQRFTVNRAAEWISWFCPSNIKTAP